MSKKEVFLMRPFLPPLEEFEKYLKKIWESRQLTNFGCFHKEFETELCKYLEADYISLFSSGTMALISALKSLSIKGEVITTPSTSVATVNAIRWNNLTPVFSDISEDTFNLDFSKISSLIGPETKAILPVHVFGIPCNIDELDHVKKAHNIRVVFDAAHSLGVKYNNIPVCNFGDLSVLSFHATKVFNTFEGGAVICKDKKLKDYFDNLINLGLEDDTHLVDIGINAKMTEFQAAIGILQLKFIDEIIESRKNITCKYFSLLSGIPGIKLSEPRQNIMSNYSYFPIIIDSQLFGSTRDELFTYLKNYGIHCRRYFYPLVNKFDQYKHFRSSPLPIANKVSENILCLPLYHDISLIDIETIVELIYRKHSMSN